MRSATTFSTQARVLMCQNCGAPIEAANASGRSDCTFCTAQNQIVGRNQTLVAPVRAVPLSEEERIARLRAQCGQPWLIPPSLVALQEDSVIPAWKMDEALAVWKQTRAEVDTTHSPDAAERLIFLCLLLAQTYKKQNDLARWRAAYESTLDTITLPRHRQIVLCGLSCAAAATNDLASAEEWLSLCDARSDDLESDSEYRRARATIDTRAGRFDRVLQVLGATNDAVPIQLALQEVCAGLRANAREQLGQGPAPRPQRSMAPLAIAAVAVLGGLVLAGVLVAKAMQNEAAATAPPPPATTTPEPPQPTATPEAPVAYNDSPEVQQAVRKMGRPVTQCLNKSGALAAKGSTRFVITAQIDAAGKVTSAAVTPAFTPDVTACMQKVVTATTFPAPREGRGTVSFPIVIDSK
jgi:hypothetical protein